MPVHLHLHRGRSALLGVEWLSARAHFVSAMRTKNAAVPAGALTGYAAAWLHLDIEPLLRTSRRLELGTSKLSPRLPSPAGVLVVGLAAAINFDHVVTGISRYLATTSAAAPTAPTVPRSSHTARS